MRVLGIETTCDETAVAIVEERLGFDGGEILANEVMSQIARHAAYGGVVPEIAARAHIEVLDRLILRALRDARTDIAGVDAIAAAAGPGLIGGILVGLTAGKALALAAGKPFVAVNHLEAHALTARLTDGIDFPYLALIISGGHTQLVAVHGVGDYQRLGSTVDDAAGEAFDKVGKMLDLPYPGGPADREAGGRRRPASLRPAASDARARERGFLAVGAQDGGAPGAFAARRGAERRRQKRPRGVVPGGGRRRDRRSRARGPAAFRRAERSSPGAPEARAASSSAAASAPTAPFAARSRAFAPRRGCVSSRRRPELCSDNGAMIAWAGLERFKLGLADDLDFAARPRWPLDATAGVLHHGKA